MALIVGACLIAFSAPGAAGAIPTIPQDPLARAASKTEVVVSWKASRDDKGVVQYEVYRDTKPIGYSNGTLVATADGSSTSTTVTATPAELAAKFTYYYAVRAKDADGNVSAFSASVAPDPHGTQDGSTNMSGTCAQCHKAHGNTERLRLGAASAGACYQCHGSTSAVASVGHGSTINVQRQFWDYTDTPLPTNGSRHRNAYMASSSRQTECTVCHTPHKSTSTYLKLLRVQLTTAPATYDYNTSTSAIGNRFCLDCHGVSDTPMKIAGGLAAYSETAGDHDTGYSASAHAPARVAANDANPGIQCEACHNKHASAVNRLVDYRSSGTTSTVDYQSGICFQCHSASGQEAGKPNTWNGRDVQAEFGRFSSHPKRAHFGQPVVETGTWTQTAQADFDGDTLDRAQTTADGSVQLASVGTDAATIFTDGFETGSFANWTSNTNWTTSTTAHTGTYSARMNNTTCTLDKLVDTSGRTSVTLTFWVYGASSTTSSDYLRVNFIDNSGVTHQVWNKTLQDRLQTWTKYTVPIDAATYGPFGASTHFQIVGHVSNLSTSYYQRVDDVTLVGDAVASGYEAQGSALSSAIDVSGALKSWGSLSMNGSLPTGTSVKVDVLDALSGDTLLSGKQYTDTPVDLSGINVTDHPSLRLKATLFGDAGVARSVSDSFAGTSLDTSKWTDTFLNGSTDPDSSWSAQPFNTTATFENWTSVTNAGFSGQTAFDEAGSWSTSTNQNHTSGGSRSASIAGNQNDTGLVKYLDTNGYSSASITYWVRRGTTAGSGFRLQWSSDGGSTWTDMSTPTLTTTWTSYTVSITDGSMLGPNTRLRFISASNAATVYLDDVNVTLTKAATAIWPSVNGSLSLRAEGAGFTGTADEGEFVSSTATWYAGDFDAKIKVNSLGCSVANAKAGIMMRSGTTVANADAANAIMAGTFVTVGNGVVFDSRATAGATLAETVGDAVSAPQWVRLKRVGNVFTSYYSADGTNWVTVGSKTITASTVVLVGPALTSSSGTDKVFADATFDDVSIVEGGLVSSATPRLDDWTVTYGYIPADDAGSMTCANCHNPHVVQTGASGTAWDMSRVSDPRNTKNLWSGTRTDFCLVCHSGSSLDATVTAGKLIPYDVRFTDESSYPFFTGWNKQAASVAYTSSGHYTTTTGQKALCYMCHDAHGSDFARLTAWTAPIGSDKYGTWTPNAGVRANTNASLSNEENLCYECHGNGTTGKQADGAANVATPMGSAYAHPTNSVSGVHSDLEGRTDLGVGKRHAECTDCHNPHAARKVSGSAVHVSGSSAAGGALIGAVGVRPTWNGVVFATATSYSPFTITGAATDYEAYLCFKCHTSYVSLPTSGGSGGFGATDLAKEFNPSNLSYHRVLGSDDSGMRSSFVVGGTTYTWTLPAASSFLKTGYTTSSMLTCTSCHTNTTSGVAAGPHGSSVKYLLDPSYPTEWTTVRLSSASSTTYICAKCHTNLSNANRVHSDGPHRGYTCNACHVKIPHGWVRPRLLGYMADPAPYSTTALQAVQLKSYSPSSGWNTGNCRVGGACSHGSHDYTGTTW